MAVFDETSQQSPYDTVIIESLNNIEFDEETGNDTHYKLVEGGSKTDFPSMGKIERVIDKDDELIRITFHEEEFGNDVDGNTKSNSKFVATIKKGQTFVANCHYRDISDFRIHTEEILAKFMTILRYDGIIEKDGQEYYKFIHDEGYVPNDLECIFPQIIQQSISIDFKVRENNFYGDYWDVACHYFLPPPF